MILFSKHGRDSFRHYLITWRFRVKSLQALWEFGYLIASLLQAKKGVGRSKVLRNNALIATAWAPVIETCQAPDSCASGDASQAFFDSMSLKSH